MYEKFTFRSHPTYCGFSHCSELHPLSVEGILQGRHTTLSKADYYVRHLFITTLCHTLRPDSEGDVGEDVEPTVSGQPILPSEDMETQQMPRHDRKELPTLLISNDTRGTGPSGLRSRPRRTDHRKPSAGMKGKESDMKDAAPADDLDWITDGITNPEPSQFPAKPSPSIQSLRASRNRLATELAIVNSLKKGRRVELDVRPLYLFLLRDGLFNSSWFLLTMLNSVFYL